MYEGRPCKNEDLSTVSELISAHLKNKSSFGAVTLRNISNSVTEVVGGNGLVIFTFRTLPEFWLGVPEPGKRLREVVKGQNPTITGKFSSDENPKVVVKQIMEAPRMKRRQNGATLTNSYTWIQTKSFNSPFEPLLNEEVSAIKGFLEYRRRLRTGQVLVEHSKPGLAENIVPNDDAAVQSLEPGGVNFPSGKLGQGIPTGLKLRRTFVFDEQHLKLFQPDVVLERLDVSKLLPPRRVTSKVKSTRLRHLRNSPDQRAANRDLRASSKSSLDSGYGRSSSSSSTSPHPENALQVPSRRKSRRKRQNRAKKQNESEPSSCPFFPCQFCNQLFSNLEGAQDHEEFFCTEVFKTPKSGEDPRDNATGKDAFLAAIGLLTTEKLLKLTEKMKTRKKDVDISIFKLPPRSGKVVRPSTTQGKRSAKLKEKLSGPAKIKGSNRSLLKRFIEKCPVPLTSGLGRRLVLDNNYLTTNQREEEIVRYEKSCKHPTNSRYRGMKTGITVSSNKAVPNHCHKYSFNNQERITRDSEIVIGLNAKSFCLLNKCRQHSVRLSPMSNEDIVKAKYKLLDPSKWGKRVKSWSVIQQNLKSFQPIVLLEKK